MSPVCILNPHPLGVRPKVLIPGEMLFDHFGQPIDSKGHGSQSVQEKGYGKGRAVNADAGAFTVPV